MNDRSINTCCPACQTVFHVTNEQLKIADGRVRCGGCLHVFNAQTTTALPKTHTSHPPSTFTLAAAKKTIQAPAALQHSQPTQQRIASQVLSFSLPQDDDFGLVKTTLPENSLSRYISYFLITFLVALCVAQVFWFQKDKWVQSDQFRPIYKTLYTLINQPLPARKSPNLITHKQLIIQPHKEIADAIRVSILLENSASFSQPFPALQLIFTDLQGRTTAQRTLTASEYVNTQLFPQQLMPSKQPIQIQLDMMTPGRRAVGYQLNFISS